MAKHILVFLSLNFVFIAYLLREKKIQITMIGVQEYDLPHQNLLINTHKGYVTSKRKKLKTRNWGLCLDITVLLCLYVSLSVRPLQRGCVILLSIKLRRMECSNVGM